MLPAAPASPVWEPPSSNHLDGTLREHADAPTTPVRQQQLLALSETALATLREHGFHEAPPTPLWKTDGSEDENALLIAAAMVTRRLICLRHTDLQGRYLLALRPANGQSRQRLALYQKQWEHGRPDSERHARLLVRATTMNLFRTAIGRVMQVIRREADYDSGLETGEEGHDDYY